jgi:hypothetical protein
LVKRNSFAACWLAAAVVFSAGTSLAADPGPIQFAPIGIGLGQTLRLTAVAADPGPTSVPGAGCTAVLGFGSQDPGPIGKSVTLSPGQSDFLDFPASMAPTRFGQRVEVQPFTTGNCHFFAEIFDQLTGFSQVLADPGPVQMPGGNPAAFSLLGVAVGQVLRLNAVAVDPGPVQTPGGGLVPPGPCLVTLGFVDRNGVRVGPALQNMTLNPRHSGFLDFPASLMVNQFGKRAEVRPTLMVAPSSAAGACAGVLASAETFDTLSGRTWAEVDPGPIALIVDVQAATDGSAAKLTVTYQANGHRLSHVSIKLCIRRAYAGTSWEHRIHRPWIDLPRQPVPICPRTCTTRRDDDARVA